ncbi:MAG TPA: radical SAM protein, partial [Candidatus Latescibacteria bacterium]|nr:radical SAM protein [Candidatus Latescibacterota bacterium]
MKPLLLHYYVTYRCNARCSFCTIWDPAKWDHRATPSWDQMSSNLTVARKLGTRFVDFTGGEPLLYHDLPRALRLA